MKPNAQVSADFVASAVSELQKARGCPVAYFNGTVGGLMNSLKVTGVSLFWNFEEKFQTRSPTTTRTIQKTRLFKVEFNGGSRRLFAAVTSRLPLCR